MPDAAWVWAAVTDERRRLAVELAGLPDDAWDRPSRAEGWRVRDVVGHLVWLAERSRAQLVLDGARVRPGGSRGVGVIARRYADGAAGVDLAARLSAAAGGRGRAPFLPPSVALGEVLAHRADITDAADLPPRPPDDRLEAVLRLYRSLWPVFGVHRRVRRFRLEPDGAGWSVGPADGQRLGGPADHVLLTVTGRLPLPLAA